MKVNVTMEKPKEKKPLVEAFALWRKEGKAGTEYFTGYTGEGDARVFLVAFINSKKENPKEPDVRVYESIKQEDGTYKRGNEVAALWDNVSESGKKYLTGTDNENKRLVGFYGDVHKELRPYIRACYQED